MILGGKVKKLLEMVVSIGTDSPWLSGIVSFGSVGNVDAIFLLHCIFHGMGVLAWSRREGIFSVDGRG